ncbi:MAG TPA: hypothetical protein VF948_12580 [Methylomirabilota bacterium]
MAHLAGRISACWIVTLALMAGVVGGCATETPVVTTASVPAIQTGGQYKLYGSGTATSPYYWVWLWQRHGHVSVLLGVDSQWQWRRGPAAATAGAPLGLAAT